MQKAKLENNSRSITDAQLGIHKNLEKIVLKHANSLYRKPIAEHTLVAFNAIKPIVEENIKQGKPLIFDSCCGTAMSSRIIAADNPNALVIGIDRSITRLRKGNNQEEQSQDNTQNINNLLLVQAECADFWSLAHKAGWKLQKHSILYPNPYPKSKHLKRRWHAHPIFPVLIAMGGEIELRTNWKVYADEFCRSVNIIKKNACVDVETFQMDKALTLFEKKYQENGQALYRVRIRL